MTLFEPAPCWYVIVATLLSLYQAYRGFAFQWQFAIAQRQSQAQPPNASPIARLTPREVASIVILRCLADTLLYLVTTAAGFVALFLAYRILAVTQSIQELSGGAATVFVFLTLIGVLGVTGQLPHLLQQGKFPR